MLALRYDDSMQLHQTGALVNQAPVPAAAGHIARPAPSRAAAARHAARKSLWILGMRVLVPAASMILMVTQTQNFIGNSVADALRWSVLIAIISMIVLRPRGEVHLRKPGLTDALFAAFFALAFTSMVYSTVPPLTMGRAISAVLLYAAVFWAVWFYADVVGGTRVIDGLLTAVSLMFIASLAAGFMTPESWLTGRFRGVFVNPNAIGMLVILFLPAAVAKMIRTKRPTSLLLVLVMIAAVILSGSRNGVVTASIGLVFMLYRIRAWKFGLLTVAVATIALLVMPMETEPSSLSKNTAVEHLLSIEKLENGGGRFEAWQTAVPIIREKLFFGHGFGTEELIFRGMKFRVHRGDYIHNSYLGLSYQLGVAGAAIAFIPLFWIFFSRLRRRANPQTAAYEAILLGGLLASLFESWIYSAGNAFAFPFWISFMLLLRVTKGATDGAEMVPVKRSRSKRPVYWQPVPSAPSLPRNSVRRFEPPDMLNR